MANRRVLVKRRKAAGNIRKITRTMQLIATARFQAAYSRAMAGKPYTQKLAELVAGLAEASAEVEHPLMREPAADEGTALMMITSSRGLCGGYNAHVLRAGLDALDRAAAAGTATSLHVVGKKGVGYMRFLGHEMAETITSISDSPRFEEVEPFANALMGRFVRGEIGAVDVAYMKFISTGRQEAVVERILPMSRPEAAEAEAEAAAGPATYEFSPEPAKLLEELLPATVRVRLYQCFTDAAVSEQVARMVAMKAATDAAGDMIKRLTQEYNRARQTAITMELLDIVGGANALG